MMGYYPGHNQQRDKYRDGNQSSSRTIVVLAIVYLFSLSVINFCINFVAASFGVITDSFLSNLLQAVESLSIPILSDILREIIKISNTAALTSCFGILLAILLFASAITLMVNVNKGRNLAMIGLTLHILNIVITLLIGIGFIRIIFLILDIIVLFGLARIPNISFTNPNQFDKPSNQYRPRQ